MGSIHPEVGPAGSSLLAEVVGDLVDSKTGVSKEISASREKHTIKKVVFSYC